MRLPTLFAAALLTLAAIPVFAQDGQPDGLTTEMPLLDKGPHFASPAQSTTRP